MRALVVSEHDDRFMVVELKLYDDNGLVMTATKQYDTREPGVQKNEYKVAVDTTEKRFFKTLSKMANGRQFSGHEMQSCIQRRDV